MFIVSYWNRHLSGPLFDTYRTFVTQKSTNWLSWQCVLFRSIGWGDYPGHPPWWSTGNRRGVDHRSHEGGTNQNAAATTRVNRDEGRYLRERQRRGHLPVWTRVGNVIHCEGTKRCDICYDIIDNKCKSNKMSRPNQWTACIHGKANCNHAYVFLYPKVLPQYNWYSWEHIYMD